MMKAHGIILAQKDELSTVTDDKGRERQHIRNTQVAATGGLEGQLLSSARGQLKKNNYYYYPHQALTLLDDGYVETRESGNVCENSWHLRQGRIEKENVETETWKTISS